MDDWKALAETAAGITTAAGIIIAGIWTYLLFVKNRETQPRATIEHETCLLNIESGFKILRVEVHVTNSGRVVLPILELECRLLQVLPLTGSVEDRRRSGASLRREGNQRIDWPMLDDCQWRYGPGAAEIEPGESETFICDFEIHGTVDVVQAYSHLSNPAKRDVMGWSCTTHVDLRRGNDHVEGPKEMGEATPQSASSGEGA